MVSMTSNPLTELRFGRAFFSPLEPLVPSRSMEPSQPYTNQEHYTNHLVQRNQPTITQAIINEI